MHAPSGCTICPSTTYRTLHTPSDHVAVSMCPSTGVVPLSRVARVGSSVTFSRAHRYAGQFATCQHLCVCVQDPTRPHPDALAVLFVSRASPENVPPRVTA